VTSENAEGQTSPAESNLPTSDAYASPHVARVVNIVRLKNFAAERLPHHLALRDVLLSERDEIPIPEFLAKLQVWLALLSLRGERG
jgi:hypothetical protein